MNTSRITIGQEIVEQENKTESQTSRWKIAVTIILQTKPFLLFTISPHRIPYAAYASYSITFPLSICVFPCTTLTSPLCPLSYSTCYSPLPVGPYFYSWSMLYRRTLYYLDILPANRHINSCTTHSWRRSGSRLRSACCGDDSDRFLVLVNIIVLRSRRELE